MFLFFQMCPYKSQSENENVNDKVKLIDRIHVREKEIKTRNVQENAKTNNQINK